MDFLNSLTSGLGGLVTTAGQAYQAVTGKSLNGQSSTPTSGTAAASAAGSSWMSWAIPAGLAVALLGLLLLIRSRRN
jgi:hypothetical protein